MIGPPGTGKTTYVARQAKNAAGQYGPDRVLICSLTRAAAAEAAGRDTSLEERMIGTLHAHCFRGLGRPKIMGKSAYLDWNQLHPAIAVDVATDDIDDSRRLGQGSGPGTGLLQEVDLLRAKCIPESAWPQRARHFNEKWRSFKKDGDLCDFTDLLERALVELPIAPGSPAVIFGDEAQDFSALELALLRRWAQHTEQLVLVGDPDQALYHWRGAEAGVLSDDRVPAEQVRILSRSFRVPRAVHAQAVRMMRSIRGRLPVQYQPTEEEGRVEYSSFGYKRFESLLPVVEKRISAGRSVMVLTSCEYMLRPILKVVRERGLPYQNPYAERWNPLDGTGTSTWSRLRCYLRPFLEDDFELSMPAWTPEEIRSWVPMLRVEGNLRRGARSKLLELDDDAERITVLRTVLSALQGDAADWLWQGNVHELVAHASARFQAAARYPLDMLQRVGAQDFFQQAERPALDRPWVVVGTIHSVKGGQADTVVVFPDLSASGYRQAQEAGWMGLDAIRRLFYVAMTRARQELILAAPSTKAFVRW